MTTENKPSQSAIDAANELLSLRACFMAENAVIQDDVAAIVQRAIDQETERLVKALEDCLAVLNSEHAKFGGSIAGRAMSANEDAVDALMKVRGETDAGRYLKARGWTNTRRNHHYMDPETGRALFVAQAVVVQLEREQSAAIEKALTKLTPKTTP